MVCKFVFVLTTVFILLQKDVSVAQQEISSSLNLSPWEMHVLSDLYIELSLLRCPSINRSAARSLKRFIASRISDVTTESETMNAEFYPAYQHLVNCLEYLDTGAHSKRSGAIRDVDKEKDMTSSDFPWETEMIPGNLWDLPSTNAAQQTISETESPSGNQSTLSGFWSWLRKIFSDHNISRISRKTKRDVDTEVNEVSKRTELARKDFHTVVEMFSRIVSNTCRSKYSPSSLFTASSIQEIVSAVALDPASMLGGVDYFFVKAGLWQQVRNCLIDSSKSSAQVTAPPPAVVQSI